MSCWSVLGLAAGADARSIKRQYAALLRQYRPDVDPVGFQRLREAYEQALSGTPDDQPILLAPCEVPRATPLELHEPLLPLQDGPTPANQLAERLLEGISADTLSARLEQARVYYCAKEFEDGLLRHCRIDSIAMSELAERSVEQFQWLTPWQRDGLARDALDAVLINLLRQAERQLDNALCHENGEGFVDLCRRFEHTAWLQSLDRRQWLNTCYARLLLHAPFWSNALFDAVCSLQGWKKNGYRTPCPEPLWERLLERRQRVDFLEEQQRLAAHAGESSESRAARLLFRPMSDDARVVLTAGFTRADWQACEVLASTVQRRYPALANEVPENNPYFWRPLCRPLPVAALGSAVLGAACVAAWAQFYRLGSSPSYALVALLLLAAGNSLLGWGAFRVCRRVGQRTWHIDQRASARLAHWLSPRRPAPLLIRESLPSWLLGLALALSGGWQALVCYVAILAAFAALGRVPAAQRLTQSMFRHRSYWPRDMLIGGALGVLAATVWVSGNYRPLAENSGLQAWPERLCLVHTYASQACEIPTTHLQWYGPVSRTEVSHDQ